MNGWDAKTRQRHKEDRPSGSVDVDMPRMYATYFRLKSNEATRPRCTILSHNHLERNDISRIFSQYFYNKF